MNQGRVLGVVVAAGFIAGVVAIMKSRESHRPDAAALPDEWADADASTMRGELRVRVLTLGDGGVDQRSIRVRHPDIGVQKRLRDWLEPREANAVATGSALECLADTATRKLVSLRCVSVSPDAATAPVYEGLTLLAENGGSRDLMLADVLRPGVGQTQVVEACKKAANPPLPCGWPPSAFSLVEGTSLFLCHNARCVDIDANESLVRPDLAGPLRDD